MCGLATDLAKFSVTPIVFVGIRSRLRLTYGASRNICPLYILQYCWSNLSKEVSDCDTVPGDPSPILELGFVSSTALGI